MPDKLENHMILNIMSNKTSILSGNSNSISIGNSVVSSSPTIISKITND